MGIKLSFLSKIIPRNLDASTTGLGEHFKCHHVSCATDRNVHTVFLIRKI